MIFYGGRIVNKSIVTEIVEFKLTRVMTDEEFIPIVDALEINFHSKQKGFIDTELVRGKESGQWLMIQHWESLDDAKEVVKMMMKIPITEEFRQSLDPTSVKMSLLYKVKTWTK